MVRVTLHKDLSQIRGKKRRRKARRVAALMETVINSDEFRGLVLRARFEDLRRIEEPQVRTAAEVLTLVQNARELSTNETDGEVDLVIRLRPGKAGSQIGWTDAERGLRIEMKKRWFDMLSKEELVGHWTHEWMHQIGFIHDQGLTRRRLYSVPYVLGEIATEVAGGLS